MQNNTRPLVLLIAGVDSGGGAGITADVLTVHDLKAWPLPCVSALTAQSLKAVDGVEATCCRLFETTLETISRDFDEIAAAKVGLITTQDILEATLSFFENKLTGIPLIWDPVLTATAGRLDSADLKGSLLRILRLCTIFTPNLPEAMELAGWSEDKLKLTGVEELGRYFIDRGARCVIIKGGHAEHAADACDVFVSRDLCFKMSSPKVSSDGAHGGGCALSSALAALIACGYAPHDAAVLAKAYVLNGIRNPGLPYNSCRPPVGHNGMPSSLDLMPGIVEEGFPKEGGPFEKCPLKLGLYPVVDSYEWIVRLIEAGVKTIQLRIKDKQRAGLFEEIKRSVDFAREHQAALFIDDHYELAIRAGAYGVHLGMEDLRHADLPAIQKAGLRLGVSTHGPYEMLKALQLHPSYIALGHIFPTNSKKMPSKPQGVARLAVEMKLLEGEEIATVAIGGIKLSNVRDVLKTGVGSIALITGITLSEDPIAATREWLCIVEGEHEHAL